MRSNWLTQRLRWRWHRLQRYWFLLRTFRNGRELLQCYRQRLPCGQAILRDGTVLLYNAKRRGLIETILEIWLDEVYTKHFFPSDIRGVIVDAGANVGLFSIWVARRFPQCRILAFEPFPENFELLVRNVRSANLHNVECHQLAFGGASGTGRMRDSGGRSVDQRLEMDSKLNSGHPIQVISLAEALQLTNNDRVALFKIDIEGSEREVFEAVNPSLLAHVDRFAIEYHDNIRPGTLQLLQDRLTTTHTLTVHSDDGDAYGMLYGIRRTDSPNP